MPSSNTVSLTATGYAQTSGKNPFDTMTTCMLYPTTTSVGGTGTWQGTRDANPTATGNWFNVACRDIGTGQMIPGGTAISPTDSTPYSWEIPSAGLTAVRFNQSAYTSGTFNYQFDTESYVGLPAYTFSTFGVSAFSGAVTFAAEISPLTNDGAPLGDTTHNWSDLFLATGAVINYANGNVVVTHTSGILTMGTGDFRVSTAGTNSASVVTVGGTQTLTSKTFTAPVLGAATGTSLAVTAGITSSGPTGAGIGYATGAGGAVSQLTDRTTTVVLSKLTGQITTQATSLAAGVSVQFTVTNTTVAIGDVIILSIQSGPTTTSTFATVVTVAAGSFKIQLTNAHASTADTGAAIINFAVIKAVAA